MHLENTDINVKRNSGLYSTCIIFNIGIKRGFICINMCLAPNRLRVKQPVSDCISVYLVEKKTNGTVDKGNFKGGC